MDFPPCVSMYDALRCSFRVLSCCLMVKEYLIKIIMVVANLYYYATDL
jgi:hypothetical protein